jgi:hypothetical protein
VGKIVVTEFVSLDGVIEDPGGSEDGVMILVFAPPA